MTAAEWDFESIAICRPSIGGILECVRPILVMRTLQSHEQLYVFVRPGYCSRIRRATGADVISESDASLGGAQSRTAAGLLGRVGIALAILLGAAGWFEPLDRTVHATAPSLAVDSDFGSGGVVTYDGGSASDPGCVISDGTLLSTSALLVKAFCNQSQRTVVTKFSSDGSIDTAYGVEGRAVTAPGIFEVAVADAGTGVAFAQSNASGDGPLIQRIKANGQLDVSLGSDGTLQLPGLGIGDLPRMRSATVDSNGRSVLHFEGAGTYGSTLIRLTPAGSVDTTFGNGGVVKLIGHVPMIAVRPSGEVVWLSFNAPHSATMVTIGRVSALGQVDSTFASGGTVQFPVNFGNPYASSLVVGPSGEITVFASAGTPILAKITAGGVLDSGFDGDGLRTAGVLQYGAVIDPADGSILSSAFQHATDSIVVSRIPATGSGAAAQSTVNLAAAGDISFVRVWGVATGGRPILSGWATPSGSTTSRALVVRLQPTLELDTTFDSDGITTTGSANYALLTPADQIVVVGEPVARLDADGHPDTTFSGDGLAPLNLTRSTIDQAGGIVVDSFGRLVVGGSRSAVAGGSATVWRYLTDGTLDPAYGSGGIAVVPAPLPESVSVLGTSALPVGIDSTNRVYAVVSWYHFDSNFQFAAASKLVRLTADGVVDDSYTPVLPPGATVVSVDSSGATLAASFTSVMRLAVTGDLDGSYGVGGAADIPAGATVVAAPDGGFLACNGETCVRRTASGFPDSTFGTAGTVPIPALAPFDSVHFPGELTYNGLNDLRTTDDGGAVLLVSVLDSNGDGFDRRATYAGRLTADGTFDPTFAGDGFAILPGDQWARIVPLRSAVAIVGAGGSIARLRADGTLDSGFSDDGLLTLSGLSDGTWAVPLAARVGDDLLVWESDVALVDAAGDATQLPRRAGATAPDFGAAATVDATSITLVGTVDELNPGFVLPSPDLLLERFTHGSTPAVAATPAALGDVASTSRNQTVDVAVTSNDSVSVGGLGAPAVISEPSHGTAAVLPNGSVRYSPVAGFAGSDSFRYQVCSVIDTMRCARATASINVAATVPGVVAAPTGNSGDATVALAWLVPDNGGSAITDYTIQASIDGGGTWTTVVDGVSPAPAANVTGLVNGTGYRFRVAARNAVGIAAFGQSSLVLTPTAPAIETPVGVLQPLTPARLLDSRPGYSTVDGQSNGIGIRGAGSVTELQVTGRGGVLAGATAVALNVTVTEAQGSGFVTVYPCDAERPAAASNLNFVAGQTVPNAVIAKLSSSGKVCLYTHGVTHLIVDVNGKF